MIRGSAKADLWEATRIVAMARAAVRPAIALCAALAIAACASSPGAQQTAMDPRNGDGLGGTGITETAAADNPYGDGLGGTGIVGTISGFGSIIVNGLKLEFDRGTVVGNDGRPAGLDELRVGQVIQGVARKDVDGLYLERLDIQHAVAGPIAAIDYKAQMITVLGQKVLLNLAGDKAAIKSFKTLAKGDVVSVSGLRTHDGTIIATRVDQQGEDGRKLVRGDAAAVGDSKVRIGDLEVALTADAVVSAPAAGERVLISGRMIDGTFVPGVIIGGSGMPFDGAISDVSLEGYAPPSGPLKLHGLMIDGAELPSDIGADDRIVVTGHVTAPNQVTATAVTKVRTVVTIMKASGTRRPAALRPETNRPERIAPPRFERPDVVRPDIERPNIERPGGMTGV